MATPADHSMKLGLSAVAASLSQSTGLSDFAKEVIDEFPFVFIFFDGHRKEEAPEIPREFTDICTQPLIRAFLEPQIDSKKGFPVTLYLQQLFAMHRPDMYTPDAMKGAEAICIECKKPAKHTVYLMGFVYDEVMPAVTVAGLTICDGDTCVAKYHTVNSPTLAKVSGLPIVALYPYESDAKRKCMVSGGQGPHITLWQKTYLVGPRRHLKIIGYPVCNKKKCNGKADDIKKKDHEKYGGSKDPIPCGTCGSLCEMGSCGNYKTLIVQEGNKATLAYLTR